MAIAVSLYPMWAVAMSPPEALIFRGTHLLFALVLVYLLYPAVREAEGQRRWWWLDALAVVGSAAMVLSHALRSSM